MTAIIDYHQDHVSFDTPESPYRYTAATIVTCPDTFIEKFICNTHIYIYITAQELVSNT